MRTLYSKLVLALLLLFLVLGVMFVGITLLATEMYQMEVSQKLNRELAQHVVAEYALLQDQRVNKAALRDVFHMLMVINPSIEVYLLDPQGRILAHSLAPDKVRRERVDLAPISAFLHGGTNLPIPGSDPRSQQVQKAFSVAPIITRERLQGYLYVILGGEAHDTIAGKLRGSFILSLSAWAVLVCLLFALAAGAIIFAQLTRRLRRLTKAMDSFQESDFSQSASLEFAAGLPRDEIDRLGATFNRMAGLISTQVQRLKHNDTLRRELVANVSHDLRTPLASLQGYLETLLIKQAALSEDEKRSYLTTAVRHSKHLGKLIGDLFELAKLDARDTLPQRESLSLSELVQDVILKFQLQAKQKNVAISADIGQNIPFIQADIGLVERALDNLIENALRYTPAGGTIRIVLTPESGRIRVQISDSGSGIPLEELPYIFDRFYRRQRNSREDSGAGLGLAITKRIIDLHGGSIEVHSQPQAGTVFSIYLPCSTPAEPAASLALH